MKVFDSKIELLKSAFNEMRAIYKAKNLELQNFNSSKYITISEFLQFFKEHNKADSDIKLIIVNSLKRKDRRFKYNKVTKKLLILRADFSDLV